MGDQRAVDRDRQRLLGDPALPQRLDPLRGRLAGPDGVQRGPQRSGGLLVRLPLGEQGEREVDALLQGAAAGDGLDDHRERARREVAGGVAVGEHRALHRELEHQARLPGGEQPERGRPHHRAAGLGVRVLGPLHRAEPVGVGPGEAGQAALAGGALGVQPLLAAEPAEVRAALVRAPVALGGGPAQVGQVQVGGRVPAAGVAPDVGADEPVDGEQAELGVVGDGAGAPVRGDVAGDALRAVLGPDLLQRLELDAGAERVADGPAEQAAPHPAAVVLLLGA